MANIAAVPSFAERLDETSEAADAAEAVAHQTIITQTSASSTSQQSDKNRGTHAASKKVHQGPGISGEDETTNIRRLPTGRRLQTNNRLSRRMNSNTPLERRPGALSVRGVAPGTRAPEWIQRLRNGNSFNRRSSSTAQGKRTSAIQCEAFAIRQSLLVPGNFHVVRSSQTTVQTASKKVPPTDDQSHLPEMRTISSNDQSHLQPEMRTISSNGQSHLPPEMRTISSNDQSHLPPEMRTISSNDQSHLPPEMRTISSNDQSHLPPEMRTVIASQELQIIEEQDSRTMPDDEDIGTRKNKFRAAKNIVQNRRMSKLPSTTEVEHVQLVRKSQVIAIQDSSRTNLEGDDLSESRSCMENLFRFLGFRNKRKQKHQPADADSASISANHKFAF